MRATLEGWDRWWLSVFEADFVVIVTWAVIISLGLAIFNRRKK